MLNEACPECNTPIFRDKNGELICASCNRKVIIVKDNKAKNNSNLIPKNKDNNKDQLVQGKENKLLNNTYKILEEKIIWVLEKIKEENQTVKVKEYVNLLKDLYELIKIIGFLQF